MTRRRPWSWLPWLTLLPALVGAYGVARIGLADALAPDDAEAALHWWPAHADARLALASAALESGQDPARIGTQVRALLHAQPLNGRAYRVLAQLAEQAGDATAATALYTVAARRAPRDRAAHGWLVNHLLPRGDVVGAVFHLDQLLRIAPGLARELWPTLADLAALPDGRTPLLRLLGEQAPPWRSGFLGWLVRQPDLLDVASALHAPLRAAPVPLTPLERAPWVGQLQQAGRAGEAYFVWVDGLAPERRAVLGNVYDGGFELPPDQGGFGWTFGLVPGATVHREATTGTRGAQSLVIDFHDRRVPFQHVEQRLALPAGHFLLTGRVRLDGLRNERGLLWQVRCMDGTPLAASDRFEGSSGWREFAVAFTRPTEHCHGQLLQLRLDARIAPEQMVGGRIWFDDLRIQSTN